MGIPDGPARQVAVLNYAPGVKSAFAHCLVDRLCVEHVIRFTETTLTKYHSVV